MGQKFILIALPEEVNDDLAADIACEVQDAIDVMDCAGKLFARPKVIAPIPSNLHDAIDTVIHLPDYFGEP